MSAPEYPAETEARQIIAMCQAVLDKQQEQTDAINALGEDVQWVVKNATGLFQMFGSPQFMAMLPQVMAGGIPSLGGMNGPAEGNAGTANGPTGGDFGGTVTGG